MYKTLRFSLVSLLIMLCGTVFGQEVTLDFTNQSEWDIPTSGTNKDLATFTDGTTSIKLYSTNNYKLNSGYLILGKANSYLELPAFDFDVEKIVIEGTSGASAAVKQNIFVGETAVSEETTGAQNVTNTYEIAAAYQAAGNIYKVMVTSNHNTQISKLYVYKKAAAGQLAKPEFTPNGGTFYAPQEVSLSAAEGAAIYYTLDGSAPTAESTAYTAPFTVNATTTVNAIAVKDAQTSEVATATFTFPEITTVNNTLAFAQLENGTVAKLTLTDAVVTYVNGTNFYVQDAAGALYFYATNITATAGQKVNGTIVAKNSIYNTLPELTGVQANNLVFTDSEEPVVPTLMTVADMSDMSKVSMYVKTGVVDIADGKLVEGESTIVIYDTFKNKILDNVEKANSVSGIITVYKGTYQFAPIAYEEYVEQPSNDYTSYIVNAALTGEGGFDATGTKGIDGSGIVKVGSAATFDFAQTIANLPAGQYKLTAQAAYRYSGSEQAEYDAIQAGTDTKYAMLYAIVGTKTVLQPVMNRYDGASETDLAAGNGSVQVNGLYVPNSSAAVQAWFNAGKYVNELVFNLPEDGSVKIGIVKTSSPDAGDYTVLGPWTLTRLGDAEAEPEPEPEPMLADGKYYIENIASHLFWGAANDWGTRASLLKNADYVTLAQLPNGNYTMESQVSNGGTNYYFGGDYMDGQPVELTITKVADGKYTIANGTNYYGWDGTSNVLGKNLAADSENALWTISTEEDMMANLQKATADKPVDATFLITDHTFGRNNRNVNAWNNEGSAALTGGNSNKHCAEKYHGTFNVSQKLTKAPAGIYKFTAQGFYRQDGDDNDNLPVFYANNATAQFPVKTGSENSMADACTSFEAGLYQAEPIYVEVTEAGELTVGAKLETNGALWCIWDNFELTYYGTEANIDQLKNAALFAQVDELRNRATELSNAGIEVEAVKTALQEALAATAEVTTAEQATAAVETLTAAIDKAEASLTAKATFANVNALVEATNVYTEEAYNNYNAYYTDWLAKYNDGTLTKAEANAIENPATITGWHANVIVDNFLLSAWDTNPDFQDAAYYINTWSVEGENDGSEFKVPFFEYWTGDGESLGEKTLTATMNNLEAGDYDVTAWVRVRMKNGAEAPATGITFQANDGEAANASDGAQVGTSQFFLKEVTATGTVAEDGVLKIKFNVAAENNISWLSFKNVKFEKKAVEPEVPAHSTVTYALQVGDAFTSGQTVEVKDNDATVATITYGEAGDGYADFKAAKADAHIDGFVAFTEGNGTNGNKAGGTFYTIVPKYDGVVTVGIVLNADKGFFVEEDGVAKEGYNGAKTAEKFYGTIAFNVTADKSYKFYCSGSKLGFYGFNYEYGEGTEPVNEVITTGINAITVDAQVEGVYNMRGQKVTNPTKGLYIINGKKVVIK